MVEAVPTSLGESADVRFVGCVDGELGSLLRPKFGHQVQLVDLATGRGIGILDARVLDQLLDGLLRVQFVSLTFVHVPNLSGAGRAGTAARSDPEHDAGPLDVTRDLRHEGFDRVEALFAANALVEGHLDLLPVEVGVEIEDVRLEQ